MMPFVFLLLTLIAFYWKYFPPKKINSLYGYRTSTSMKSQENWKLANSYSAHFFLISMSMLLAVSLFLVWINFDATILLAVLLVITIVLMIVLTEKKLKEAKK